jgi:hypothetical protein
MNDTIKIIIGVLFALAVADIIGWCSWSLSGQTPPDGFYAGMLTAKVMGAPQ